MSIMRVLNYFGDGQACELERPENGVYEIYRFGTAARYVVIEEIINGEHAFTLLRNGNHFACCREAQPLRDIIAVNVFQDAVNAQADVANDVKKLGVELESLTQLVARASSQDRAWIAAYNDGRF